MRASTLPRALLLLLLASCGGDREGTGAAGDPATPEGALPRPAGTRGSVTGMPDAGTPAQATPSSDGVDAGTLPEATPGETGAEPGAGVGAEPGAAGAELPAAGADAAVAVVRDYFSALNAGDFARAYTLWSEGGAASGQSAQQFVQSQADTLGVSVEIGAPGAIEDAGSARVVEVPVSVQATQRDGGTRRLTGRMMLRQVAGPDGTGPWRIASSDAR